jgi:hypothetical protein
MEAQPPQFSASTTVQPTRSAFPPDGLVNVALQTPQAMDVVAREKIIDSLPQSRQLTFRKWLVIEFTSSIHKFEFLGTLARCVVGFAGFCAPVENVDALGWLLATVGFWTGETTVSSHHAAETSLTPAKLRGSLFLDTLNRVEGVLASRRAVAHNLTGSLHHVNT